MDDNQELIRKTGKICSVEHPLNSYIKRQLCIDIDGLKIHVADRYLECFSDEDLINRTATIICKEKNGEVKLSVLLKVDNIFYKGIVYK